MFFSASLKMCVYTDLKEEDKKMHLAKKVNIARPVTFLVFRDQRTDGVFLVKVKHVSLTEEYELTMINKADAFE